MQDQIVLLEARKEVTTFLLDDGDITSKDVVTETGQGIGYEYSAKLYPEDTVTISPNSQIGNIIYFVFLGILTAVLRHATKIEIVSFAILLGNLIVPLIDKFVKERPFGFVKQNKQKEKK